MRRPFWALAAAVLVLPACGDDVSENDASDAVDAGPEEGGGPDADADDADVATEADDDGGIQDGGCTPVCSTGTCCDGTCVDLSTDAADCGECGHACPWGNTCAREECRPPPPLELTILVDNTVYDTRLGAIWGFAAWVTGLERTILLDTGADGPLLLANMDALGLDALDADLLLLSHDHTDHTAGLADFLGRNADVTAYLGASFSAATQLVVRTAGATLVEVAEPVELTAGAYSTGEMGVEIPEHGLLLATADGPVLITGCAHPGIVALVERALEISGASELALVGGGFHLLELTEPQVRGIIANLQALGVRKVAPTHCTGDAAIPLFREAFGADFVELGAGRIVALP